jgi:hypothetical protein
LFAKHIVIPICDGYKPERDFKSLLEALHRDFLPAGFYEEWLVVKIAECMWRLRRTVLAQREMEKRRSPLVHRFRPFGAGIF